MKAKKTPRKSETDFERIDSMTDEDIDLSDIPEITPEQFANGIWRHNFKPIRPEDRERLRELFGRKRLDKK